MTQYTEKQGSGADVRLPRPPGVLRRALADHPIAVDVFIVVWFFIGCGLGLFLDSVAAAGLPQSTDPGEWFATPGYAVWPWWPLVVLRVLAVAAALLLRRRYPLLGLIVVTVALFGDLGMIGAAMSVALLFMIYAVPVYRSVPAGWLGYGIALTGTAVLYLVTPAMSASMGGQVGPAGALVVETPGPLDLGQFIGITVMSAAWYLAILMLGINLGNRRRYLAAVIDRAHQLARERDQLAQLAVAEERSRIAREMHDIVAHSVSVMIALSEGAARAATAAPEAAAEAMARSAETGRTALAEMRRMLGALQAGDGGADMAPQPGVEDLPELVRGFRDAGLAVELAVTGEASGDRGQDLAVYRMVQEGLTNVLRYAGVGARARVEVERDAERTRIEVRDFGSAAGVSVPATGLGSGRGIAGLRERARFFGGTVSAGPASAENAGAGAGWLLRAELPVSAAARERGGAQADDGLEHEIARVDEARAESEGER